MNAQQTFENERATHLSTWGPNCGAPKSVYEGHLRVLLDAAVAAELERLGAWVRRMEYNRDDAPDEIARAIENRVRQLARGKR